LYSNGKIYATAERRVPTQNDSVIEESR
jgi:hypothetical protein